MAFIGVAGGALFGGGAFGSLAFNALLGIGMIGVSYLIQSRQHSYGPRLESLKVSDMPIGAPIPLRYGEDADFATCIWIKGNSLIEKSKTERQGKGGPSVTTYSYYLTAAFAIADNLQTALRKCWANDKVIINFTSDGDTVTQLEGLNYAVYLGTETQMPDPTMEAVLGVGNTPAYRGVSYIVFNELPLDQLGNSVPQIRVQMTADANPAWVGPIYDLVGDSAVTGEEAAIDHANYRYVYTYDRTTFELVKFNLATGEELLRKPLVYGTSFGQIGTYFTDRHNRIYVDEAGASSHLMVYDTNTLEFIEEMDTSDVYGGTFELSYYTGRNDEEGILLQCISNTENISTGDRLVIKWVINSDGSRTVSKRFKISDAVPVAGDYIYWLTARDEIGYGVGSGKLFYWTFGSRYYPMGNIDISTYLGQIAGIGYYPDDDCIVVWGEDASVVGRVRFLKFKPCEAADVLYLSAPELIDNQYIDYPNPYVSGLWNGTFFLMSGYSQNYREGYLVFGGTTDSAYGGSVIYVYDLATMSVAYSQTDTGIGSWQFGTFITSNHSALMLGNNGAGGSYGIGDAWLLQFGRVSPNSISIKSVFDDWNTRVGMSTSRAITADLSAEYIHGYTWKDTTSISEAFSDIMTVWGIDTADEGNHIRFIRRGTQTPVTIDPDDLGAAEGPEADDLSLKVTVDEGYALPKSMTLKHKDQNAAFEVSIQDTFRHSAVVSSKDIVEVSTNIVMDASTAAGKLLDIFKAKWRGRVHYEGMLPQKYKQYAPGDVFQVTKDGYLHEFIVEELSFDPAVINFKGTREDVTDWANSVVGISTQVSTQHVSNISKPVLYLLDINALRDDDVNYQFYLAVRPTDPLAAFTGVVVYRGSDPSLMLDWMSFAGTTYWGTVQSKPTNVPYPQMFDETASLTVYIAPTTGFTPQSVTKEQILNDRTLNPMLILCTNGNGEMEAEIVQYAGVTLVDTNTYRFDELLRGQRGTEFLMPYTEANSVYVLFPDTTHFYREGVIDDVNAVRYFQPITFGASIPSTNTVQTFTNTAKARRPYAPADLIGTRDASTATLTIDWKRRTTIYGFWAEGTDIPLEYTVEEYKLRIYTDSTKVTLLRTETITSVSTYDYTLANYNTDTAGAATSIPTIYVEVTQVGDDYGEGVPAKGSL